MSEKDKPLTGPDNAKPSDEESTSPSPSTGDNDSEPVYEKPLLRKYGQLDRVVFS